MKSYLPFLNEKTARGRRVFSFGLFLVVLFIGLASLFLQSADLTSYAFIPSQLVSFLGSLRNYAFVALLAIPVANRILFALERAFIRSYLNAASEEEKEILARFTATKRMIDVPLETRLIEVQNLARMGIIEKGTGLAYRGEHSNSPHTYYSMTTWVFYYLIDKTLKAPGQPAKPHN